MTGDDAIHGERMKRCAVADCSSFADVPVVHDTVEGMKTRHYCDEHSELALRSDNAERAET